MLSRDLTGRTGTHRGLGEKESWNWLKLCDRRIAAKGIPEGLRSAELVGAVPGGRE